MKTLLFLSLLLTGTIIIAQKKSEHQLNYNSIKTSLPAKDSIPAHFYYCGELCSFTDKIQDAYELDFDSYCKKHKLKGKKIEDGLKSLEGDVFKFTMISEVKCEIDTSNIEKGFNELKDEMNRIFKELSEIKDLAPMLESVKNDPRNQELNKMLNSDYESYKNDNKYSDKEMLSMILYSRLSLGVTQKIIETYKEMKLPSDGKDE